MLTITSWNINSVRIRLEQIRRCVEAINPDILCLQETKTSNEFFPVEALRDLGFHYQYFKGQKSYNGVAILSKIALQHAGHERYLPNDEERHIRARLPGGIWLHNFYVPAGGDIPDPSVNPKFKDKLAFLERMIDWSHSLPGDEPVIMLGDMNIAPMEHDVWSHKQLLNVVSHTPIEVETMQRLKQAGEWIDTHREFTPAEEKLYSWWSYRNRDWAKSNRGRRLDHIWITPALKNMLQSAEIYRDARGWDSPSDHVPISITLDINLSD